MFEHLSEAGRRTILEARQQAKQDGNLEIQPEHLLLAILRVDTPLLMRCLRIPRAAFQLRTQLQSYSKAKGAQSVCAESADLPLSAASRRALAYAEQASERLHHSEVDNRHLLQGIFREESSYAAGILRALGVDMAAVEAAAEAPVEAAAESVTDPLSRPFRPSRDLTAAAAEGQLGPLIGRERELDRLVHILVRRARNNVFLVGQPGVGKTALLEGLAVQIVSGTLPLLAERRLVSMDAGLASFGIRHPARLLERKPDSNSILCIEGLLDMKPADVYPWLEPNVGTGGLQCIATGTPAAFRRFASRFGGLTRRFELLELPPNTPAEAIDILRGLKERYEKFHGVTIEDDAIPAAVRISGRALPQRYLPDRALDLLDDAGARTKLRGGSQVTAAGIAEAAAERAGMPLEALQRALELHKPLELEVVARELAARLPPDQHAWLPYLAAYLAGCSPEAAEELVRGIQAAIANR
jgi:ATP-dependent Clp protease ATP-binding subunit ClpC